MTVTRELDAAVSRIAAAIGDPGRACMLFTLMDNRARTSTELAVVAQVSPSTASVHLSRLKEARLVKVVAQGKHRFYSLAGAEVASALEGLSVLAAGPRKQFVPSTPDHLRAARTCYDHVAGTLGVALHDRFKALGWLARSAAAPEDSYDVTAKGALGFGGLGVDIDVALASRRRLAFACLDWSERRFHLGGAVGAGVLDAALRKKWLARDRDGRALRVTTLGHREMLGRLGVSLPR